MAATKSAPARDARALGLAAAVACGAAAYVYLSRNKKELVPYRRGFARGRARVFTLTAVDRTDAPGGKKPGPAGRPAANYLDVAESDGDILVSELFAEGTDYVLYSIEDVDTEPFLVFVELPPENRAALWRDEPFIDRGFRKQMQLGARVAVASLASVELALAAPLKQLATGTWAVAFVWNTGRCGSTLLHKATTHMGAVSLSEPHWLDQLMYASKGVAPAALRRALAGCVAAEAMIARRQSHLGWGDATRFFLNPKAGPHVLVPESVAAFPTSTHLYMYRACEKVVQSFAGLKFGAGIPLSLRLAWRAGISPMPLPPKPEALRELSSFPVAGLAARWIGNVAGWADLVEKRRESHGPADPVAGALHVRFDEFTSKDLAVRKTVLRAVLAHVGLISQDASDDALAPALKAFEKNSQAGSAMAGKKGKVVLDSDLPVLRQCVREGLADVVAAGVVVEGDGANVLLPRTVGARE